MQHFQIKIFARPESHPDLGQAIPVFHRWIQESEPSRRLIDVADYRHVPAGPGVILVGHDAIYGLDESGNRLGLLYSRRTTRDGSPYENLRDAYDSAVATMHKLEAESAFAGQLSFKDDECEIAVNDRAAAPNTPETEAALKPVVAQLLDEVWGQGKYTLNRVGEPRDLLRFHATKS